MNITKCFICNATIPDIEGPVSEQTYLPQSPGCWKLYTEVLAREYSEWKYPSIHRLTVDCYAAQHPTLDPNEKSAQSVTVHQGTKVSFILSKSTNKHLKDIFSQFETDHSDPDFDKTKIQVKLYTIGTIYISRSQARRILTGLERFKTIILNFERVSTIGQAFADEIFRVFKQKYPDIKIIPTDMNEAVKYMVDRAITSY